MFNDDAPVKSHKAINYTPYVVVRISSIYFIWCISRPLRTFYESINDQLSMPDFQVLELSPGLST